MASMDGHHIKERKCAMNKATPGAEAKLLGTTIKEMHEMTRTSKQTLSNWYHRKTALFRVVAIGTAAIKNKPP